MISRSKWTQRLLWTVLCLGVWLLNAPAAAQRNNDLGSVPGQVLVGMKSGTASADAMKAMTSLGQVKLIDHLNFIYKITLKPSVTTTTAITTLKKRADVKIAELNYYFKVHSPPAEGAGLYALQWGIPKTKTDLAWPLWTADTVTVLPAGGPNAPRVIAMLDTGIAFGHQDLFSKIQLDANGNLTGFDFVNNNGNPWDDNGHGTHTAGIAAARTGNGIGIAGIASWNGMSGIANSDRDSVKIMPIKVMDALGYGSAANIIQGIDYARTNGAPAHIICICLGAEAASASLQTAVNAALAANIVVVAAAGNDSSDLPVYPAAYAGVISVASTDNLSGDVMSSFSNFGTWVRTAAPGSNIYSTTYNGNYGYQSGTSQAAALVAGEAALLRSMTPTLTQAQIYNVITKETDPYTPFDGNTLAAGAGRVNVRDAVVAAQNTDGAGLVSVSIPATMANGDTLTGQGTVTLANASVAGLNVVVTWTGTDITVNGGTSPQTVAVAAGASSATFDIAVANVPGAGSVTVTATQTIGSNTLVRTATGSLVNLINTMTIVPTTIKAGQTATGTVTLNTPAPVGGSTIALASATAASATVPATVVVPAGATSATFTVTGVNLAASGSSVISATYNTDVHNVTVNVTAAALTSISVSPKTIGVGQTTQLTVTLDGNAPTGGLDVTVTSSDTNAMADPGIITVPAGSSTITVASPATTSTLAHPITADYGVTLSGTDGSVTSTAIVTLRPMVASVSVAPTSAKGAATPYPTGTVTLSLPAPVGGLTVALTSSDTTVATVPATVTFLAGDTTATFTVTTLAVAASATTVVSATNQFATRTTTYTGLPPALSGLTVSPASVLVGTNSTGTVTLDSPAPTGGTVIALSSSTTTVATVPATVTVCARNTGIYSSFLVTLLYLLALGRGRAAKLPPVPIITALVAFVLVLAVDGINSMLLDVQLPHLYTPQNWLRTLTGTGMGVTVAVLLLLVLNISLRKTPNTETRIIKNWLELGGAIGLNLLVLAAMYGNISFMYWPIAISAWAGITGVLYLVNLLMSALFMGYDGRVERVRQLAKPATLAIAFTLIELAAMSGLRYWLEGQGMA